jgi:Ca2+-binding EF-hand superfamily protein
VAAICADMGTTLNKNELESALFMLDKNGDGKVSLEEFQVWWGVQELTA